jgi:copper(I)-binding protein
MPHDTFVMRVQQTAVALAGTIIMKKFKVLLASLVLAGPFGAPAGAQIVTAGDIEISNPQARAMVPGAKVGGGYLSITNKGNADDKLVGITSTRAKSSEIHQMNVDNGVMTMRLVAGGVVIPAGQTVELTPGGYHVMFTDVTEPFKQGETVRATLTFEKAGQVAVEFAVGGASAMKMDGHSGMSGMSKPQ